MHFYIKWDSTHCLGQATNSSVGMVLTTLNEWFDGMRGDCGSR